jgi:hypothetical protein
LIVKGIPKQDLFGIFFVRKFSVTAWGSRWDLYYNTITALRALFDDEKFAKMISGFYLNHIDNSVRISYFVNKANNEEATSVFRDFFKKNGISEIKFQPPSQTIVAANYGGEELEERFRYFLSLETQIGLELIKADVLYGRTLFATYCLQVRKASLSVRQHFEPAFMKYSSVYSSLSKNEREQFLSDLQTRLSWGHMMVNFVLGCDFEVPIDGKPLSISEINVILEKCDMGFRIPFDWKPS